MCNKDTPPGLQTNSMISRGTTVTTKPARKTRTPTRKPKFLSLRLELTPTETSQESVDMSHQGHCHHRHSQLNLFPLHPENLVEEKDIHDENVAYFFHADGGATLTGLLGGDGEAAASHGVSSEEDSLSPSLTYAYRGQDSEEGASSLVRTALRNKERDASEEKWVCYSEVVEKKEEEVSSCSADLWYKTQTQGLSLKLDYQEILNAWSDKGSLYIETECPQTVPDVLDELLPHDGANVLMEGWGSGGKGGLWRVPEKEGSLSSMKKEKAGEGKGEGNLKMGQREASVLRYKEKRQNRLFSKRIRYEVRKLNAEKRPRMKGRFVKRN